MKTMHARKLAELSLMTGVALMIFIIELQLPNLSPVPGVKLGLANIITVCAVYRYSMRETLLIVAARILLGSIFSGQAVTLLYSAAGSALCLTGMMLLRRLIPLKHIWICSVLGAVCHNVGQILTAIAVTRTPGLIAYLPILLVSGCVAGAFTGFCAQFVLGRSALWRRRRGSHF